MTHEIILVLPLPMWLQAKNDRGTSPVCSLHALTHIHLHSTSTSGTIYITETQTNKPAPITQHTANPRWKRTTAKTTTGRMKLTPPPPDPLSWLLRRSALMRKMGKGAQEGEAISRIEPFCFYKFSVHVQIGPFHVKERHMRARRRA